MLSECVQGSVEFYTWTAYGLARNISYFKILLLRMG